MTTDIFNAGTPVYPDMAVNTDGTDNDVTDATSGQLNVVAASGAKQLAGWGYTEKPARNVMNWIHRLTTQWIRWLYSNAWHADIRSGYAGCTRTPGTRTRFSMEAAAIPAVRRQRCRFPRSIRG